MQKPGKRHCNRRMWQALETLREQKRQVDLRDSAGRRTEITAAEAARLILSDCYAWKLRNGLVRSVWAKEPKWEACWRTIAACVLYPAETYGR